MELFGVAEVATHARSNIAPGWAYVAVPDSIPNPNQPQGRKRAARNITGAAGDTSAKQDAKVLKSLQELDKDSGGGRDVQIPVPIRARDGAGRVSHGKVTPNVRKILQSAKTFANHLSDFEALAALNASNPQTTSTSSTPHPNQYTDKPKQPNQYTVRASPASTPAPERPKQPNQYTKRNADGTPITKPAPHLTSTGKRSHKKKPPSELLTPGPKAGVRRGSSLSQVTTPTPAPAAIKKEASDVVMGGTTSSTTSTIKAKTSKPEEAPLLKPLPANLELKSHPADNDPLLKSRIPPVPSDEVLRALISAPPLTYLEARGTFSNEENRKPPRMFCEICGYWGRVKCLACGSRVCALECLRTHKEECYTRYGA